MSRMCRNIGDSGKRWFFYELDHDESNMLLLKTHSYTSNGLAMEPGTRVQQIDKQTCMEFGSSVICTLLTNVALRLAKGEVRYNLSLPAI